VLTAAKFSGIREDLSLPAELERRGKGRWKFLFKFLKSFGSRGLHAGKTKNNFYVAH